MDLPWGSLTGQTCDFLQVARCIQIQFRFDVNHDFIFSTIFSVDLKWLKVGKTSRGDTGKAFELIFMYKQAKIFFLSKIIYMALSVQYVAG